MADNKEKQPSGEHAVELTDLPQEMSEEQMKDVKGGDWKIGSKPIVVKKTIRP